MPKAENLGNKLFFGGGSLAMAMVLQSFQRNECIFPEKIPQSFFFALLCLLKGIEKLCFWTS